jgi:hypothetical protein
MRDEPFRTGDRVRLRALPPWVSELPAESQAAFRAAIGRPVLVREIDSNGLLVLELGRELDEKLGGSFNDIRVEAGWVEKA